MYSKIHSWHNPISVTGKSFKCGYCSNTISSDKSYVADVLKNGRSSRESLIYTCPHCFNPTFFNEDDKQIPGPIIGDDIGNLDSTVHELYNETRQSFSVGAYTLSVLGSRKLLMNIAVSQGVDTGLKFAEYVKWLDDNHYTPPNSKVWVDHIRNKGNEATHEIPSILKEDAEDLITMIEMILKFVYEYPAKIKPKNI